MTTTPTCRIPTTDLVVSRLAYGCMRLGVRPTPATTDEALRAPAHAALDAAHEIGCTHFDHADIYAGGRSEELFGAWLKSHPGLRDRIVIQSKCGIRPGHYDFSAEHLTSAVEGSLKRLGIGHLDVLALHRPDALGEPEVVAQVFDQLHRQGKVRHFGVSNHSVGQIELLRRHLRQPLVLNQLELNPWQSALIAEGVHVNVARGVPSALATGILDHHRLTGIMVQTWRPLGGKILSEPSDQPAITASVKTITELAAAKGISPEALLLAWQLRHPAGFQPLIGSINPSRIRAAAAALTVELTRQEWYQILTAGLGNRVP